MSSRSILFEALDFFFLNEYHWTTEVCYLFFFLIVCCSLSGSLRSSLHRQQASNDAWRNAHAYPESPDARPYGPNLDGSASMAQDTHSPSWDNSTDLSQAEKDTTASSWVSALGEVQLSVLATEKEKESRRYTFRYITLWSGSHLMWYREASACLLP